MAEMMINGDNLIRYCMERRCGSVPIERIKSEPRIEVERVRHARWINNTFCSDCKRFPVDVSVSISNQELTKYFSRCPHCGAQMDLHTPTEAQLDMVDSVMMGGANSG